MTVTKEVFVDLQEKYNKVVKLIKEDSKLDPETDPYLSKYAARQILITMKASLKHLLDNLDQEPQVTEKLKGESIHFYQKLEKSEFIFFSHTSKYILLR